MSWKKVRRFARKVGHFYADIATAGQTYNARKQEQAARDAEEEQKRANAEIERQQMLQAGAPPTEMTQFGSDLNISGISGPSALQKSILARQKRQQQGGLGAGRV